MQKNLIFILPVVFTMLFSIQTGIAQNSSPFWSLGGNSNASATSKLGTTNSIPLRFLTNNVERVRIDASGRMGIGTSSPVNLLTVKLSGGTPAASWLSGGSSLPAFIAFGENMATGFNLATAANSSGYRPVLNIRRSRGTLAVPTAVTNNDYLASFVTSGYDGSNFQNPAAIDFYVDGVPSAGSVPGRISFVTGTNAGNRAERLKVRSNGDVSIETGNFIMGSATRTIQFATPVAGSAPMMTMFPSGTINSDRMVISHSPAYPSWGLQYQDISDKFNFLSAGNPVLTADLNRQRVGVGTASPDNRLHIKQSVTNRAIEWQHESQDDFWTVGIGTNTFNCRFEFNGNLKSQISSVDGSFIAGSDLRLKEDIIPLPRLMDKVMRLKPTSYFFKDGRKNAKNKSLGFIAQDVEPLFPEAVYDFDGGYKGLNYAAFSVIAVKAIQEQEQHIEEQQKTINNLLDRISRLEALLNTSAGNEADGGIVLEQNSPNPFKQITTFRYKIPNGSRAQLNIYDISGKLVKSMNAPSDGQAQFNNSTLPAGTYEYTLVVNGKKTLSKKMVLQ